MTEHPFISVIVVTYNSQSCIADCLQSIFRAGINLRDRVGKNWETVVVDNASTDNTVSIVKEFNEVNLIVNYNNLGFSAGVNRGAKETSGEWLLIFNPDCILDENAFMDFHEFLSKNFEAEVIGLQLFNLNGSLQPSGRRFPKVWEFVLSVLGFQRWVEARLFSGRDFTKCEEIEEVSGAAFFIRRKVWQQVGGMDENFFLFFEDLDLCRRVKQAGYRITYLPYTKARHAWGKSVRQVPLLSRLAQQHSAMLYFRKHHSLMAVLLVRIALLVQQFVRFIRYHQSWHWINFALLLFPQKPFAYWKNRLHLR